MEEESLATLHLNSSSAIRFLGLLKQPDSDSTAFELDESDVVWSADFADSGSLPDSSPTSNPASPVVAASAYSPAISTGKLRYSFRPEKFGLSAALADEGRALVQRKAALNPSLSAASAARTIPPVPLPRSGSSSEDFSGSSGKYHQSAPVNVPLWSKVNQGSGPAKVGFFYEDDEDFEEEMLPPHEIVAKSHMTTFSVFEGVGRTLKGRDLRRVRNAVWQKTGNKGRRAFMVNIKGKGAPMGKDQAATSSSAEVTDVQGNETLSYDMLQQIIQALFASGFSGHYIWSLDTLEPLIYQLSLWKDQQTISANERGFKGFDSCLLPLEPLLLIKIIQDVAERAMPSSFF